MVIIDPVTRRATLRASHRPVTGITKLVQIVVISLLNVPGQDILDPDAGGGLPELIGLNFDPDDSSELMSEVARRVRKTEVEVLNSQIGLDCPPDERLKEVTVLSVGPGAQADEMTVRLRVVNELGQRSDIEL